MSAGRRGTRRWSLVCLAVATFWPSPSRADAGSVQSCLDAAEDGQKLRDGGAYLRARERFIACAGDACPGEVRRSCVSWLGQLEELTPTVVVGAQAHGSEVTDVRITMDGKVVGERIDGKPIPLDPGSHRFRFERGGEAVEETTVIRAGEKERLISVRFGPAPAPTAAFTVSPPPASARGSAYTLGAIGLSSLAAGGVLDLSGYAFLQSCGGDPSCTGAHERAEVEWRFLAGDLLLGAGVLCGAVAWLLWSRDPRALSYWPVARPGVASRRTGTPMGWAVAF
jgi:hypothetical protein